MPFRLSSLYEVEASFLGAVLNKIERCYSFVRKSLPGANPWGVIFFRGLDAGVAEKDWLPMAVAGERNVRTGRRMALHSCDSANCDFIHMGDTSHYSLAQLVVQGSAFRMTENMEPTVANRSNPGSLLP